MALITGGSSGIGQALARRLTQGDWAVVLTGRDRNRLGQASQEFPAEQVLALAGDAADGATVQQWVRSALDRFGRLDAAVANAGFATTGWLSEDKESAWREMILTNCLGPALLIHHSRPHLVSASGRIILVGSVAGLVPTPGNLYGATKYAITGLAENTRRALTGDNVGVTLIAPGRIETPFWDDIGGRPEAEMLRPDDVARSIEWALQQPPEVDVNTITVRPFQSAV